MSNDAKKLAIYGAGEHGEVIYELCIDLGYEVVKFIDDNSKYEKLRDVDIISSKDFLLKHKNINIVIAIGNNKLRKELFIQLKDAGYTFVNLIHPNAQVSKSASIKDGTTVLSGSVIGTNATIGYGCIINTGTIVEHNAVIEDFVHLSPGTTIGAGARIGEMSHLNMGTIVNRALYIDPFTETNIGKIIS